MYILLNILKLKEITLVVLEIFFQKIAQFSSHFSSHIITNIVKLRLKNKLLMF